MSSYVESGYVNSGYVEGENPVVSVNISSVPTLVIGINQNSFNIVKNISTIPLILNVEQNKFLSKKSIEKIDINILLNSVKPIRIKTLSNPIAINLKVNSASYKNIGLVSRATTIDGISFKYPFIYEKNFTSSDYISQSTLAIDGSSVISVAKKAQFAREFTLRGNFIHKDELSLLFESLTENIINIEFNTGLVIEAKYDLLNNAIEVKPIYDGAEYYEVVIRILV